MVINSEQDRTQRIKNTKIVTDIKKIDRNTLNINNLVRVDPSLATKVIRSDKRDEHDKPHINYDYADNECDRRGIIRSNITSLLDSDEESQQEYEEELGFKPDPDFFDKLDTVDRSKSTASRGPQTDKRKTRSRSKSKGKKKQIWNVEVSSHRTSDFTRQITERQKHSKTGKVLLTDDLLDQL